MANSKDALGHNDTYLDANRKILSQEMLMCNMEAKILINRNYDRCQFKRNRSNVKIKG